MKSDASKLLSIQINVAPARERGLKSVWRVMVILQKRRSREGAWIEIPLCIYNEVKFRRRSREGAWIEMNGVESSVLKKASLPRGSVD